MQEVSRIIIEWVGEAEEADRQSRVEFVRQAIGQTLYERLQAVKSEETIVLDSISRLGLPAPEVETEQEILLSFSDYMTTGVELLDNRGVWTRLWSGLWRKHRDFNRASFDLQSDETLSPSYRRSLTFQLSSGPDWGGLFSREGDLSVTRLDPLVRNQYIRELPKIGEKSLHAARLLVEHLVVRDESK